MVAKSQLKCIVFLVLTFEITTEPLKQDNKNIEEVKPQIKIPETEADDDIDEIDDVIDTEEEIDEGAEKSDFDKQMRNIRRYEALLLPEITRGVPLVQTVKQERAKQGQKNEGTSANLKIANIVQEKLQQFLSRKENEEGS